MERLRMLALYYFKKGKLDTADMARLLQIDEATAYNCLAYRLEDRGENRCATRKRNVAI